MEAAAGVVEGVTSSAPALNIRSAARESDKTRREAT